MKEELREWLSHYVTDAVLSPVGVKIVSLVLAGGNLALWVRDNINFIAALVSIIISILVYIGSKKKRELEMKLIQKQLDEHEASDK